MTARFMLAAVLQFGALLCLFAATTVAPDMKFPRTPLEWIAVNLFVIGLLTTFLGFAVIVVKGR